MIIYDRKYLERNYTSKTKGVNSSHYSIVDIEIRELINLFNTESLKVCEIGCGDGRQLVSLAKKYKNIQFTGVDFLVKSSAVDNLSLFQGDLLSFFDSRLNDDQFHLIYGIDVFEHLSMEELVKFGVGVKSKLYKKGVLLARVPNMMSKSGQINQFGDLTHKTAFNVYSAYQLIKIFDLDNPEVYADSKIVTIFKAHFPKNFALNVSRFLWTKTPNIFIRGNT
jgi:2-polyprenyl-3-methyl-5-hydroxy-6-metoxy-1,4-benzoquinol methylase